MKPWSASQFVTAMGGVKSEKMKSDTGDDLYEGYGIEGESDVLDDDCFRDAVKTSYGQRKGPPMTSSFNPKTASRNSKGNEHAMFSTDYRPRTGHLNSPGYIPPSTSYREEGESSQARPITAVRPVGFSSKGHKGPLVDQVRSPDSTMLEETADETHKKMEQDVIKLVDESILALDCGEKKIALEKAKRACQKEKLLQRHREIGNFGSEASNLDITFAVLFNVGTVSEANDLEDEALSAYNTILNNKVFGNAGRLRVNIGNIFFKQGRYTEAIRMYRRALDQISEDHAMLRSKILQNIGCVFVKMEQYTDAIVSFEHIFKTKPSYRNAFNLLLCYYSIGDIDKMKKSFQKLLSMPPIGLGKEEIYVATDDNAGPVSDILLEAIKNDELRQIEDKQKWEAERCVLQGAKLIAPKIEASPSLGFEWCVECIKASCYETLASELEVSKAMMLLRTNDFAGAVQTLNVFEKKTSKIASTAANNLSFLYFLKGDIEGADRYADQALNVNSYNYHAHVNKGNVAFVQRDFDYANKFYRAALDIESGCLEALYNQGLTYKAIGNIEAAETSFLKADRILRNCPEILYQLAMLAHAQKNNTQALDRMMELTSVLPDDPGVLQSAALIFESAGDKTSAYQYMYESFKCLPSNIDVIAWLANYFFVSRCFQRAMNFFEKCILVEQDEVKWYLLIAVCQQRNGMYQEAYVTYRAINLRFPNNEACLKTIVKMCTDLGLQELEMYQEKLKKAKEVNLLEDKKFSRVGRRVVSDNSRAASAPKCLKAPSVSTLDEGDEVAREKSAPGTIRRNSQREDCSEKKSGQLGQDSEITMESVISDAAEWYEAAELDELVPDSSSINNRLNK